MLLKKMVMHLVIRAGTGLLVSVPERRSLAELSVIALGFYICLL